MILGSSSFDMALIFLRSDCSETPSRAIQIQASGGKGFGSVEYFVETSVVAAAPVRNCVLADPNTAELFNRRIPLLTKDIANGVRPDFPYPTDIVVGRNIRYRPTGILKREYHAGTSIPIRRVYDYWANRAMEGNKIRNVSPRSRIKDAIVKLADGSQVMVQANEDAGSNVVRQPGIHCRSVIKGRDLILRKSMTQDLQHSSETIRLIVQYRNGLAHECDTLLHGIVQRRRSLLGSAEDQRSTS